jgi:hypothetical protein
MLSVYLNESIGSDANNLAAFRSLYINSVKGLFTMRICPQKKEKLEMGRGIAVLKSEEIQHGISRVIHFIQLLLGTSELSVPVVSVILDIIMTNNRDA